MIKAILFDLGNVIVPFDFKPVYARMEALCGYPAAEIPQRLRSTDLVTRFESGQIEPEDFVRKICGFLELKASYAEFCNLWTSIFDPAPLIPESLIEDLRQRYRLVLLSNTNAIHFEMIRQSYALLRHFHAYVLSYQVGAMKPSPEIYREAVARAGCRPEECFFTDDVLLYVEAARREGIDAVQFVGVEQLQEHLRERGVLR